MPTTTKSFDELHVEDCLRLLETQPVGRLAINRIDDGPLVVPVNYVLDGDTIVFRIRPGLLMDHSTSSWCRSRSTRSTNGGKPDGVS